MALEKLLYFIFLNFLLLSCASKKHVQYLKNHSETQKLSNSELEFHSLDDDFYDNQLFLVGEIHEVSSSPRIDVAMFKQLHDKAGVRIYVAEMDIAQGYYINEYIKGSNALTLEEILKSWVVGIGRNSAEVRNKYKTLREFYATLPDNQKFEIVGIEMNIDYDLLLKFLNDKLELPADVFDLEFEEFITWGQNELPNIIEAQKLQLPDIDYQHLNNILFNFKNYKDNWYWKRDKYSFANFKRLYNQRNWQNSKLYACFGFGHTLQAYPYTLAGRIKRDKGLNLTDKMVSMNALYVDSHLTATSSGLPKIMRSDEKFTKFKLSYDNYLFTHIKGINDFKRASEPNSITLFKLNGEDSPYNESLRGTKNFALIPLWDGFEIEDKNSVTTDYAQYIFFVRNADWVEPDQSK